jgi:hypothetical protein
MTVAARSLAEPRARDSITRIQPLRRGSTAASASRDISSIRSASQPGRYGLLLTLLLSSYLLSSFVAARWVTALTVGIYATAVVLSLRTAQASRMITRLVFGVVVVGSALVICLLAGTTVNAGLGNIWAALVLLGGIFMIVHRVLLFGTVTLNSIFGAVSAYLLLGLMFAAIYGAIDHIGAGHLFANGQPDNTKTFQYFSFTTLTTLGYGDFTAAENGARSVAMLEAISGQVFLATLVARLVSAFRPVERGSDRADRADAPGE